MDKEDTIKQIEQALNDIEGFTKLVGSLQVVGIEEESKKVLFKFLVEERHTNTFGFLHGGVIAYLIDVCGSLAITVHGSAIGVSTDISVSYLKGTKVGQMVDIEAEAPKVGGSLAFSTVRLFVDGKVIAYGNHTKYVAQKAKL
ncbi:Acyl-coenzyme A thioesterase 13 [Terramyces sp. JEL0728]|nr:Acyl-coenzyme A thioesterase 13 [Terramyces sp. JEL0728]